MSAVTASILVGTKNRVDLGIQPRWILLLHLDGLTEVQRGDLRHGIRIARETGGRLYLAATVLAGSRLTEKDLLALPEWEINLATTVLSRDWVRIDAGHLEVTDYRTDAAPLWALDSEQREWADPTGPAGAAGAAGDDDDGRRDRRTAESLSTSAIRQRAQRRERELEEMARQQGVREAPPSPSPTWLDGFFNEA